MKREHDDPTEDHNQPSNKRTKLFPPNPPHDDGGEAELDAQVVTTGLEPGPELLGVLSTPPNQVSSEPHNNVVEIEWDEQLIGTGLEPGPKLLSILVGQCETLNQKYRGPIEASILYYSDEWLQDELKKAWNERSFKLIRQLPILQAPRKSAYSSDWSIDKSIAQYSKRMIHIFSDEVPNKWKSAVESQTRLDIPEISHRPDLLIHELGEWSNPDGLMAESIRKKIFRFGQHTMVCGGTGTGKTRYVLEGLSQHWGFFFSCRFCLFGSYEGSNDISREIDKLSPLQYRVELRSHSSAIEKNREIAQLMVLTVWLARLIVFEVFLASVPATTSAAKRRQLWVLLQLYPTSVFGTDVFVGMKDALYSVKSVKALKTIIGEKYARIQDVFLQDTPIFAVFDDAQHAKRKFRTEFVSDDLTMHIPILGEVISTIEDLHHNVTIILSGTCSFANIFRSSSASRIGDLSGWHLFTPTGAFDNQRAQEQYIIRYVWPDVEKKEELSLKHQLVLERAWRWLRGRYQFTVIFVQLLLRHGTEKADVLLDTFFAHSCRYQLTDYAEDAKFKPRPRWSAHPLVEGIGPVPSDRVSKDPNFWVVEKPVIKQILRSLFRSETIVSHPCQDLFVEAGYASYRRSSEPGVNVTLMDEPVVLLSAASWLHDRLLKKPLPVPVSLELLALYFLVLFDGTMPLDEVVEFATKKPSWAGKCAEVLIAYAEDADGETRACVVTPKSGPSPTFGVSSQSGEETLRWLRGADGVPFCFPNDGFGPDILFLIKVGSRFIWAVVQAKFEAQTEEPDENDNVKNADSNKDSKDNSCEFSAQVQPNLVPPILNAFCFPSSSRLSNRRRKAKQGASDSILRLVLTPPSRPYDRKKDKSPYPLAFVDFTRLAEVVKRRTPSVGSLEED
ncbi:hypothetical protein BD410DRAFT_842125 [Rickenella mellea]|uniref:Uncharacterized protein n=1 Tax=Rickenella mellea TaxID=50990 RepID=A0A4Y7PWA3_9AGAM|nr:hypothetical protein BD410DRAFT_842125 [Rickenella mellea]